MHSLRLHPLTHMEDAIYIHVCISTYVRVHVCVHAPQESAAEACSGMGTLKCGVCECEEGR